MPWTSCRIANTVTVSRVKLSLWLPDAQATETCGRSIASWLPSNALVYLLGGLGAGKTTLSRGILRGLGHSGPVKSPTYTLLEPYDSIARGDVYHFDFYRIQDPAELEFIGIDEIMESPGLKLVEWPTHAAGALPAADWTIELQVEDAGRRVQIC